MADMANELDSLKQKATLMGITFHPSIGVEKLKAKIAENTPKEDSSKTEDTKILKKSKAQFLTAAEFAQLEKQRRRAKAGSLVRIRLTNMNPNTKEQETTFISAGSAKLGTFKRYVPFNQEWHVENILYEALKEKKCSTFFNAPGPRGNTIRKSKLIPEFAIEVLPDLTEAERQELKQKQMMSDSIDK